jgi:hypothetical protein
MVLLLAAAAPLLNAQPGGAGLRPLAIERGHCRVGEALVFDCPVNAKRLSVCASPDYDARTGKLSYRYGPPGAVELELPKDRWKGAATEAGHDSFPNGSTSGWLRFHNGPTGYVVYHSNVRVGSDGWEQKAGVAVEQPKRKQPSYIACTGKIESRLLDDKLMNQRFGFMQNSEARPFDFP